MKLLLAHTKAELLALVETRGSSSARWPFPRCSSSCPPPTRLTSVASANFATGSFMTFAVFTVTFFQLGVGTANERENPWSSFVRTLPASPLYRNAAKVTTAAVLALLAALVLVLASAAPTPLDLPLVRWPRIFLALAAGGVMMGMLGTALAYLVTPKAALPLANLIYLPLAFMGGMWMPPELLPRIVQEISPYLPSRQWMELVWPAVGDGSWDVGHWLAVAGFTVAFAALAGWAQRRDEAVR